MKRLAILGPGLLGGSIALAAKDAGAFKTSIWARRENAAAEARAHGIGDHVSCELRDVVSDADLIVLCVPIGAMAALARKLVPTILPRAIITDVGSVKAPVVAELSEIFRERGRFIGSHPMAGSEQAGIEAARADLFSGATCVLTPDENSDAEALRELHEFWNVLGCRVVESAPAEHDALVALVSHLPHLAAAALVQTVAAENPKAFDLCGPGFRDCTRVASGPPEMWSEILRTNREAVARSTEAMIEKLRGFLTLLARDDRGAAMTEFLTQAKAARDRLGSGKTPHV